MMWLKELLIRISEVVGRGMSMLWWKSFFYFFSPLVLMIFNGHFQWMSPLWMASSIMSLAILKQLIWDVIWHHYKFDWIDLIPTVAAILIGLLMTGWWW